MKKYYLFKKFIGTFCLLAVNCLAWGEVQQYAYCSFITTSSLIKLVIPQNCHLMAEDFTIENATNEKPLLCTVEWNFLLKSKAPAYEFTANFPSDTQYENWNGLPVLDITAWNKAFGNYPPDELYKFFGKLVAHPVQGGTTGLPSGIPAGNIIRFTVYGVARKDDRLSWWFSILSKDEYHKLTNLSAEIRDGETSMGQIRDIERAMVEKRQAAERMSCLFNSRRQISHDEKARHNAELWKAYRGE